MSENEELKQFWTVTFDGQPESVWHCDREVVAQYVDEKPQEGTGRNSIDANGRWKIVPTHVYTSLEEKHTYDQQALMESGLAKLTDEEKKALGLSEDNPESPDP